MAPWGLFGLELKYKKKTKVSISAKTEGVFINIYRYYGNTLFQEYVLMTVNLFKLMLVYRYFLDISITTMHCINSKCHTFGIHYSYQQSRSQHLLPHFHHFPQCTARLKKNEGNKIGQSLAIKIFLYNMSNWSGFKLNVVMANQRCQSSQSQRTQTIQ